ncbi:MAG: fumarate hydratase, partial [Nitrospinota bacterium]
MRELCIQGTRSLAPGMREALERALELEESPFGKEVLRQLLENALIA